MPRLLAALVMLAGCARPAPRGPAVVKAAHRSGPLFRFASNFWVNLHERLYGESGPRPLERSSEEPAWATAVAFYAEAIPDRGILTPLEDERLVALHRALVGRPDAASALAAGELPAGFRERLAAAAPVYRAGRWAEDDRANRAWVAALEPLLDRFGPALAEELAAAYGRPWPAEPMAVDVAPRAGAVGAYTLLSPTHITIANGEPGTTGELALEMVFHEASHALVEPVEQALERACHAQGKPVPPTLWHALLFYTAGELARRHLGPSYVPYARRRGLWARSTDWTGYERLLAREWQPFLDGRTDRESAITHLVAGL